MQDVETIERNILGVAPGNDPLPYTEELGRQPWSATAWVHPEVYLAEGWKLWLWGEGQESLTQPHSLLTPYHGAWQNYDPSDSVESSIQ